MLARDSLAIRGAAASLIFLGIAGPAFAYRPFDGTDAAVAAPGELEVELQPAGVRRDGATPTLVAPWTVLNFGLSEGWEAVFEGQGETPLSPSGPTNLIAAGAFLKDVVLPGSLQGKSGPSIATEFGVLLPDSTGDSGVGASWAGIISQRWDWGTINLNVETVLTRDHHADVFLGSIIEGPAKWRCGRSRNSSTRGNSVRRKPFPGWSADLAGERQARLRRRLSPRADQSPSGQ